MSHNYHNMSHIICVNLANFTAGQSPSLIVTPSLFKLFPYYRFQIE